MVWPEGIAAREAVTKDVDDLVAIDRAAVEYSLGRKFPAELRDYPEHEVRGMWTEFFARSDARCLIATKNDSAVGFIAWADGQLVDLAVDPLVTRRGIGGALLREATSALLADGDDALVWVLEDNSSAIAFYVRHGWKFTGDSRIAAYPPYSTEVEMTTSRAS